MNHSISGQGLNPVGPVNETDDVLRAVALLRERDRLQVGDVSKALSITPHRALRLLSKLHFHGFLARGQEPGCFVAGPALIELGLAVVDKVDLRMQIRPYIENLSRRLGETVSLMMLSGRAALFLDCVESERMVRVSARVGRKMESHLTAGGKAILAQLSQPELIALLGDEPLIGRTPASLTDLESLQADLAETQQRGYALNIGESEPDVVSVAMVIGGRSHQPPAAISVSAPHSRVDDAALETIIGELRTCVAALSTHGSQPR